MKQKTIYVSLAVLITASFVGLMFGFSSARMNYPEGYRDWTHVKTLILEKGHPLYESFGGTHHIYANKKALEGYKSGGQFKDGSVIVFDLLETLVADNAVAEGSRKVVGVMQKDSKKFKETDGWGFEGFKGDTKERVVADMYADCFACHTSQKDNDYVFSQYRK
jgi:hypothetical protein